jgi:hypothetical protein
MSQKLADISEVVTAFEMLVTISRLHGAVSEKTVIVIICVVCVEQTSVGANS